MHVEMMIWVRGTKQVFFGVGVFCSRLSQSPFRVLAEYCMMATEMMETHYLMNLMRVYAQSAIISLAQSNKVTNK